MKSRYWNVKWPGSPYAWGPFDYHESITEREVRRELLVQERKAGYDKKRLPVGLQVYPA